jgi:hypothetical protein
MQSQSMAEFAGHLRHVAVDRGRVQRNVRVLDRTRIEKARQQREPVVLALEEHGLLRILEAREDRSEALQVFAHARAGAAWPRRAVATLVVSLDLAAETQAEASVRQLLQVPGALGGDHRAARKGDGDIGGEPDPPCASSRDGERQERVVPGLGCRHVVEAQRFEAPGAGDDLRRRDPRLALPGILGALDRDEIGFDAQTHGVRVATISRRPRPAAAPSRRAAAMPASR